MSAKDILDLIQNFEQETWKYESNDNLDNDMQYIYSIESSIKNVNEANIGAVYNKLISLMGMIKFKYGFEGMIIKSNPELINLKTEIEKISLDSNDITNQYANIASIYKKYISNIKNLDFLQNKYENQQGKEGLYLAVESLKSLITNDEYKKMFDERQINDILIDCVRLNNGLAYKEKIEAKYKEVVKQIWERSLSNTIDDTGKFRVLFSNISGGDLRTQAKLLIDRPDQSSCSMISSDFIATYLGSQKRIGFIYPNTSEIVAASAYDLGTNVFGKGVVNKEKESIIATPEAIEKIGIARARKNGEDLYYSSSYNEIAVSSKPCGIVIIGLGENDLNVYYEEAKKLADEMNLPLYNIDTMQYKDTLSNSDKEYISFHSIISFFGISSQDLLKMDEIQFKELYQISDVYKDQISQMFLSLKQNGNLSRENMVQMMNNVIDRRKLSEAMNGLLDHSDSKESNIDFIATKDVNEVAKIHSDSKYINWRMEYVDGEYRFYSPNYKKQEVLTNSSSNKVEESETYLTLEELEPILSEQGYMCLGHGTGRFGNSDEVVESIFDKGLRTKDNSLYFTTIGLSTPTPEIKNQYHELGLPEPTIEDLKKQFNSWKHQDSKKIIIARIPTDYINMTGDRSDLDGEMYGAFMNEELSSDGKITNYLNPKFIVGCFDVEKQAVKLNKEFERTLSPETISELKSRYIKALEKTKARLDRSSLGITQEEVQGIVQQQENVTSYDSYDSFDFPDIEWDYTETTGKKR